MLKTPWHSSPAVSFCCPTIFPPSNACSINRLADGFDVRRTIKDLRVPAIITVVCSSMSDSISLIIADCAGMSKPGRPLNIMMVSLENLQALNAEFRAASSEYLQARNWKIV